MQQGVIIDYINSLNTALQLQKALCHKEIWSFKSKIVIAGLQVHLSKIITWVTHCGVPI